MSFKFHVVKDPATARILQTRSSNIINIKAVPYSVLIRKLGKPSLGRSPDGKVTRVWVINTESSVLTVYDYKRAKWSIGGRSKILDNVLLRKEAMRLKAYLES